MSDLYTALYNANVRVTGQMATRVNHSKKWLKTTVQTGSGPVTRPRLTTNPLVGQMYLFHYDPKTKAKLPYYDTLPLIFPFEITGTMITGINMHYLPPPYRAQLMDALSALASKNQSSDKTHLLLSYQILSRMSRFRYFKPCVKQYARSQIRGSMIRINADEWHEALFLPIDQFHKASRQQVFNESLKQIKGK